MKWKLSPENKGTRRHYHIEDRLEAGLVLKGSEVKALRQHSVNLNKSYAQEHADGFYLVNAISDTTPPPLMADMRRAVRVNC